MSARSIKVVDLETTTPNHVIEIDAMYFDSRNKQYVLSIHDVEVSENFRSVVFDFAVESTLPIEKTNRFNAGRLQYHANNWKIVPGLKELIAKICKVRELELTKEAQEIVGFDPIETATV